jgi:hypothetical protein
MWRSESARRIQASNLPSDAWTLQERFLSRSEAASEAPFAAAKLVGSAVSSPLQQATTRSSATSSFARTRNSKRAWSADNPSGAGLNRIKVRRRSPSSPTYPSTTRSAETSGVWSWPRAARVMPRTSKMSAKSARKRREIVALARVEPKFRTRSCQWQAPSQRNVRMARCRVPSGTTTRPSRSRSGLVRATDIWSSSSRIVEPRKAGCCPSSSRIRPER